MIYEDILKYLELQDIKLMPYQKQMLKSYCNNEYIIYPRQFGRRNFAELVMDYKQKLISELDKDDTNQIKVYMNGHRLYNFEYEIKNGEAVIKDSVFEKFKNKKIIGYNRDGIPKYKKNIIEVHGIVKGDEL